MMKTNPGQPRTKWFLIVDLILWIIGVGYCFYHLIVGPNPISFMAMNVFIGLTIIGIIRLRKGKTNEKL